MQLIQKGMIYIPFSLPATHIHNHHHHDITITLCYAQYNPQPSTVSETLIEIQEARLGPITRLVIIIIIS
jgi:hypothetical protein